MFPYAIRHLSRTLYSEKVILQKIANWLGVSFTALVIRLRGLGMLNFHDISEYIEKELQLGGGTS